LVSAPPDDYLTPIEAAQLLGVSLSTLLRWVRDGRIPHQLSERGEPRLRRRDVLRLVDLPDPADDEPTEDEE
jgi:excisionase family DNA binding protein